MQQLRSGTTHYHLILTDVLQAKPKQASQRLLDLTVNNVRDTSTGAARQGQDKRLAQMLHCHVPAGALDVLKHFMQKQHSVCQSVLQLAWLVSLHTDALDACASITEHEPASCH